MFNREGTTSETTLCPVFVLRKEILSFSNLLLMSILYNGTNSKFLSAYKEKCY